MIHIDLSDPHAIEKMKAQDALYSVIDPELFVNIIDLGLVYDFDFSKEGVIDVTMTLSTPHCPMGDAITGGVQNVMDELFPERKTNVNLTFDPPWSFEMLSDEGRTQLGFS